MKTNSSKSLKMSDDDEEELKNCETSKGGSGKRRTTRNESEKRRRDKLNMYVSELASMVPTCTASQKKLDKTTILKMTVNYMRVHNDLTGSVLGKEYGLDMSFLSSDDIAVLMDESLNGFLFVLSRMGEIVYASKNITPLLGFEVDQIVGKKFVDIVHPEDKSIVLYELEEDNQACIFQSDLHGFCSIINKPERHSFEIRMECVRDKHFTNSQDSYEMVHVIGYKDTWETKAKPPEDTKVSVCKTVARREEQRQIIVEKPRFLVAVGFLIRPGFKRFTSVNESSPVEFQSRHTMDGKFLFVDTRSITMTGFWPFELLGSSLYSYVHHDDIQMLVSVHQLLLEHGECKTEPYRMRTKGDQWLWMKSRSFISYNHWNSKPDLFCSTNITVGNKDGMESLQERDKLSLCSTQPIHPSIASIRNNSSSYSYKNQQEAMYTKPRLAAQQKNVVKTSADGKEIVSDLSNSNISTSASSSHDLSSKELESHHQSCDNDNNGGDDTDITDSLDMTMSYEELESFIQAQGYLHDQLLIKHTLLEKTIAKQKHQLQAVQQQMLLNLQAQLTINPGENQEVFEKQLKRTKRVCEMHDKQQDTHQEIFRKLKERRKLTEKRNKKQLNYFLEKRTRVANDASSLPQASQTMTTDRRATSASESLNGDSVKLTVIEEKQSINSGDLIQEQFTSAGNQVVNIREVNQKQAPVLPMQSQKPVQYLDVSRQDSKHSNLCYTSDGRQHVTDRQLFHATPGMVPYFAPDQQDFLCGFLPLQQQVYHSAQEPMPQRRQQGFGTRKIPNHSNVVFPSGTPNTGEPPSTLSNIQSLLTASSQNPESMQKLLSGLGSQPELAQTLLSLLKQAQTSVCNGQDSLLFDQSLEKTTNHFSAALGTNRIRNDNAQVSYQMGNTIANVQELQKQQQSALSKATKSSRRGTVHQTVQDKTRSATSSFSTSTWSGETSAVGSLFLHDTGQTLRDQTMARSGNEKLKDNKKDYFSNFTSQELEDMFLTSSPAKISRTNAGPTKSIEEAKLQEEQLLHSPLLIQQQQLLQMHQDQRKHLSVRQQEQLLMTSRQNPKFAENTQQDSFRSLIYHSNHPSTSTREQDQQPSTSNLVIQHSSESLDPLSSNNFELNEADEQVLNMLLAESSMDTLLDPSPWPETDSLLEYLNMNPDLTSD